MINRIDLHIHTQASDGSDETAKIIDDSKALGLKAIAITDHDTLSGLAESPYSDLEIVPGIEFSTKYMSKTHILGYYIDPDCKALRDVLRGIVDDRDERNEKIVELMRQDGIPVSYPEMRDRFGEIVGRPHFAEILIENGYVSSVDEAFSKFLDRGQKYWVKSTTLSLEAVIGIIVQSGGTAVLAHPFEYQYDKNSLSDLIETCISLGARGIECRHSSHTPGQMAYLESLADDYGLIKTGGSDYHGTIKPDISLGTGKGIVSVPYSWLEKLKEARR